MEAIKGGKKVRGKPAVITVRERSRGVKEKCMAEGKKELIGLLCRETSPIHSLGFI